jgi:hypothetical protein
VRAKNLILIFVLIVATWNVCAETRFAVYDVFIDPAGDELAGYQVKIEAPKNVKFAGVEGGDHKAYKGPPVYDSKAINRETIILAALGSGVSLPREKTRVATLHVQVSGGEFPELPIKLQSAGNSGLKRIFPKVTVRKRGEE